MNTPRKQKRLQEIEDRKIEILLQIPSVKDDFNKILELNKEYVQLNDEYYQLKLESMVSRLKT